MRTLCDSVLKGENHSVSAVSRIFKRAQTREWAVVFSVRGYTAENVAGFDNTTKKDGN